MPVKIAIMANRANSFVLPMAKGLQRMFNELEVEANIFYDGLAMMRLCLNAKQPAISILRTIAKKIAAYPYIVGKLRDYDAIVVITSLPSAFQRTLNGVELVRKLLPDKPIVNYSQYYLPTRGPWGRILKEGGHYGMERYDWYFANSIVSEYPLPDGIQPCSRIGINLDDSSLFPQTKREFMALIDFERSDYLQERTIQIEALQETNTKYIVLKGHYPTNEIRQIYRECSIYFVAHRESFGLPICELQACGSYIFTPYANWCPSHWIKQDPTIPGPGMLSPNFVVYENDKPTLIKEIDRVKASHDPRVVFDHFIDYHPHFFYGDLDELGRFIHKLEEGEINSNSHTHYYEIPLVDMWKND
jgi:hypothetical protein